MNKSCIKNLRPGDIIYEYAPYENDRVYHHWLVLPGGKRLRCIKSYKSSYINDQGKEMDTDSLFLDWIIKIIKTPK